MLVALAILTLLVTTFAPRWSLWRERRRLRGAAQALMLTIAGMRVAAAAEGRARGLAFEVDGASLSWRSAADGDGDGLRRSDLRSGADVFLEDPQYLERRFPGLSPGLPRGVPTVSGGSHGVAGVAFGRSMLLSLSPEGGATSGTLYLRNRHGDAVAVRVYGPTGRTTRFWRRAEAVRWSEEGVSASSDARD